ncbi:phage portal protein [Listeria monocytogenes]
MLKIDEIGRFINNDIQSEKKRLAEVGKNYYEGNHDIKNYKLYYYNNDGILIEDTTRSNIKISHPFFTELVDQEVQYMLSGKDGFVFSDDEKLQLELDAYFNENEDFTAELTEVLTGCISKGFEYMYAYKNEDDKLSFQCADSMGVVEVRAKDTDDNCEYVIYWYTDRIEKGKKEITRIQVWDKDQTYFYVRSGNGQIALDESEKINPKPHTLWKKENDESTYYENFGFIPFFRLDNCKKQHSGLKPIKALIDDYDLMACGLSNNIQDASEYVVLVTGYQGSDLGEVITNVKTKKVIGVGEGGNLDYKTVDIPYEARKIKLELDEKNIYRFGMGFNSAQLGDGNITNIVIKSRYALLDLKCNKLEIRLKQFLRKILKVVLKEINENNETDYQMKDVYFKFDREVMTNASDNAAIEKTDAEKQQIQINTLLSLMSIFGDEEVIKLICEVLDIDYEDIKDKLPDDPEKELKVATKTINGELNA